MIDFVLLASYALALGAFKTRDSLVVLVAFGATCIYASSDAWAAHPAWLNHIIYSLLMLPLTWFLSKQVCIAVITYISFHWVTAGDYIFFPERELNPGDFGLVAILFNLYILATLIKDGLKNAGNISLDRGWLADLVVRAINNRSHR